jgi:hypothetical protein
MQKLGLKYDALFGMSRVVLETNSLILGDARHQIRI